MVGDTAVHLPEGDHGGPPILPDLTDARLDAAAPRGLRPGRGRGEDLMAEFFAIGTGMVPYGEDHQIEPPTTVLDLS